MPYATSGSVEVEGEAEVSHQRSSKSFAASAEPMSVQATLQEPWWALLPPLPPPHLSPLVTMVNHLFNDQN